MPLRTRDTDTDRLFAALADPTRRDILGALLEGERSAGELASLFDMARPSVVEHVRALSAAGLTSARRDGRRVIYTLRAEPLQAAADWLHPYERFWRDRLRALRTTLDEMDDE